MHPLTVYGIETAIKGTPLNKVITGCMHPLTVYGIETARRPIKIALFISCMHPLTVYGIETPSGIQ